VIILAFIAFLVLWGWTAFVFLALPRLVGLRLHPLASTALFSAGSLVLLWAALVRP
jgi:hypothetical protein